MTLSVVAALLQSALLLLSAAQSTPNLPQSFRDNASVVAQEAISAATAALASNTSNTISSIAPQTYTTPIGAVIGQDGSVLSTPYVPPTTQAATQQYQPLFITLQQEWKQTEAKLETCYAGATGSLTTGTTIVAQGNYQSDIQKCSLYQEQLNTINNEINSLEAPTY